MFYATNGGAWWFAALSEALLRPRRPALVAGIEKLLGREFGITDADLGAIRVDAVIRPVKAGAPRDSSSFWELVGQIFVVS
jgi:hypothetical protein